MAEGAGPTLSAKMLNALATRGLPRNLAVEMIVGVIDVSRFEIDDVRTTRERLVAARDVPEARRAMSTALVILEDEMTDLYRELGFAVTREPFARVEWTNYFDQALIEVATFRPAINLLRQSLVDTPLNSTPGRNFSFEELLCARIGRYVYGVMKTAELWTNAEGQGIPNDLLHGWLENRWHLERAAERFLRRATIDQLGVELQGFPGVSPARDCVGRSIGGLETPGT